MYETAKRYIKKTPLLSHLDPLLLSSAVVSIVIRLQYFPLPISWGVELYLLNNFTLVIVARAESVKEALQN
jgi:hypothetical protein